MPDSAPGSIGEWLGNDVLPTVKRAGGELVDGFNKHVRGTKWGMIAGGFLSFCLLWPMAEGLMNRIFTKMGFQNTATKGLAMLGGIAIAFLAANGISKWIANKDGNNRPGQTGAERNANAALDTANRNTASTRATDPATQALLNKIEESTRTGLEKDDNFKTALRKDLRDGGVPEAKIEEAVRDIINYTSTGAARNFQELLDRYDLTVVSRDGKMDIIGDPRKIQLLVQDADTWGDWSKEQRDNYLRRIATENVDKTDLARNFNGRASETSALQDQNANPNGTVGTAPVNTPAETQLTR